MNARVRELLEGAIQSDGIEELFETGKHISVDIFSDEYMDKINAIQLPNTKIKLLQRLLSQAIEEYKKVNRIMSMEFAERMKRVVDEYNNRRKDEAFANEVLDDVAEQLAKLLEDLKRKKILSRIWALTMRKKPSMTFSTSLLANMSLNILMIK